MSFNPTRLGLDFTPNGNPTDPRALFEKVFTGEVKSAFQVATIFRELHRRRTIQQGKSASFAYIGSTAAEYHVPGEELAGKTFRQGERVINIDQQCIAYTYVPNIDEAMSSYDVRGSYSTEMGNALARVYDNRVSRVIAQAARTAQTINGDPLSFSGASGGIDGVPIGTATADLRNANAGTSAAILLNLFWNGHRILDEKNVPDNGRYIAVRPLQYYLLVSNPSSGSTSAAFWLSNDYGAIGNYGDGKILKVGSATVVKSNNMVSTDVSEPATVTGGNDYSLVVQSANVNQQQALMWQEQAVGTVELIGQATEMDYKPERQATLMLAKYAVGHGVLEPSCALEITSKP